MSPPNIRSRSHMVEVRNMLVETRGWTRKRFGRFDDREDSKLGCDKGSSEDRLGIGTDDSQGRSAQDNSS